MTASDDELGLRRWSGRAAKNGMHPHALKPLQTTDLFKTRDMIIQYRMFDMVGIFDCCQVKILYTLPDQVVLYCIIVSYCIMLHHIVLHCIIGYKYIDIMLSIAVK